MTGGDERLEGLVAELLDEIGPVDVDRRVAHTLVVESLGLLADEPASLDLKIATAALAEMRDAFAMFQPYRNKRKVTIFGSARATADEPVYRQTVAMASAVAR